MSQKQQVNQTRMTNLSRKGMPIDENPLLPENLGLRSIYEPPNGNPGISIVAIHGLETMSPRTWVYKDQKTKKSTNWLEDAKMLREAVPTAELFTYNWVANFMDNGFEKSLKDHADTFLDQLTTQLRTRSKMPIIFLASCFGGLLLAKALLIASQQTSAHKHVLRSTVGIIFLATPFHGSSVARLAQWGASVGKVMGKESSHSLVTMLQSSDKQLKELTEAFNQLMTHPLPMPLYCYYELGGTQLVRRFLPGACVKLLSPFFRKVLLVEKDSAILGGHLTKSRTVSHSLMNKFYGPDDPDYKVLRDILIGFVDKADDVIYNRSDTARRAHVMIPYPRNTTFVGRRDQLKQLLDAIPPQNVPEKCQINAIVGLDGVGKTELALEAAYKVHELDKECSVFWVRADSKASFDADYARISQRLKIPTRSENVIRQVNEKLDTRPGRWLLVLDGVDENQAFFSEWHKSEWLPTSNKGGSILLTAANRDIAILVDAPFITVPALNDCEALELLKQGFIGSEGHLDSDDNNRDTLELLKHLAGLPLAIKLASQYIRRSHTNVKKYLELWRTRDQEMIEILCQPPSGQEWQSPLASRRAVAATWLITLTQIKDSNSSSLKFLKFIALCGQNNIPISMIKKETQETQIGVDSVINDLMTYSFVTKPMIDSDCIDVHPLNHDWKPTITTTIEGLANSHPFPSDDTLVLWKGEIEHVESVLDQSNSSDMGYEPSVWRLLYMAGHARYLMKDNDKAKELHKRALLLEGLKAATTLETSSQLRRDGKYQQAEIRYREAVEHQKKALGKDHPTVTEQQKHLACTLLLQGKFQEAIKGYSDALVVEEKMLGKQHPSTITTRTSLAFALKANGDHTKAITEFEQVCQLKETTMGAQHPSTLASMDDLAIMRQQRGHHSQSEILLWRVVRLKKKVYGENHPSTLTSSELLKLSQQRHHSLGHEPRTVPANSR
ncbi:hypothetical protein BJX63DRAFT_440639 [Aspergillus granulosus]|uniref:NB-ARC domain-containing protein n=1 Tax=Aspergillus granulosus TaxID=176169 RepID=A0ABR4GV64_9EURO